MDIMPSPWRPLRTLQLSLLEELKLSYPRSLVIKHPSQALPAAQGLRYPVFGLIWWYLEPMTFLPLMLTGVCDWSTEAASALLPSLMGHLIYGAVTA